MKSIYLLGNPAFEQDSLPLKLLPKLQASFPNINFIHLDPTEPFPEEKHLILIDTIINASKISILTEKDLNRIQSSPNYSLHDFDLGFQLKLMKKLGKLKKVTIIGVPADCEEENAIDEIRKIINYPCI